MEIQVVGDVADAVCSAQKPKKKYQVLTLYFRLSMKRIIESLEAGFRPEQHLITLRKAFHDDYQLSKIIAVGRYCLST